MNLVITNRALFKSVRAGLEIAVALRRLYPQEWKVDDYIRLLANADTLERVKRGDEPSTIAASWQTKLDEFRRARARVLLYR